MLEIWQRRSVAAVLLLPFSGIFFIAACLRRWAFKFEIFKSHQFSVPVITVGGLAVGGSGKTPIVIFLAQEFLNKGYRPGIVSRGYSGKNIGPHEVSENDNPTEVGDEALLLKSRCKSPVFIGRDRVSAVQALLKNYPNTNIVISDDGLQNFRLKSTFKIAVLNSDAHGNGWLLPAGPMRETLNKLNKVDAIVIHGEKVDLISYCNATRIFKMQLTGEIFYLLNSPEQRRRATDFSSLRLHAIAGIGFPKRFFNHIKNLGLSFEEHAFPDHYSYSKHDLTFDGDAIIATEKDAVKLKHLAQLPVWVLPVEAKLCPNLATFISEKIYGCPSA